MNKKNAVNMMTRKRQDRIFCISALAIFLVHWLIFWVYANMSSIQMAFTHYDLLLGEHVVLPQDKIFDNFVEFFNKITGSNVTYLLNGAYFHIISSLLCLPFSYMIAFIIYKKLPGHGIYKTMLYLPVILGSMVTSLLYMHVVESGISGLWDMYMEDSFPYVFTDVRYNRLTVSIYAIFYGLPGSLLINLGSMSRVPNDLIEYGELEGLSLFKEFIMITVPMVFPVLQVQCLGLFTGFFLNQGPLFALYRESAPDELQTFGYYMFIKVYNSESKANANNAVNYGFVSAANLCIGIISVPIIHGTKWLFDKIDPGAEF